MAVFGFSINVFSLLAMILAVGLVVDDAIVEVENVQRHVDAGMAPMDASFRGSEEVGFAVIATTITLASVFAPMGLAGGTTGQIIREFAFTLAAAILISGFVARTLAPMLCGRLVRPKRTHGWSHLVDRAMAGLEAGYGRLLRASLRARWAIGLVVALCLAGAVMVAGRLPAEMAPREDDAYAIIKLEGPQTASLEYLERWARGAEAAFHAEPEVADALVLLGTPLPNQVLSFVVFHDWSERTRTSAQITTSIMERLATLPGLTPSIYATDRLGAGGAGQAVQLVLKTAQDYDALAGAVEAVRSAAAASAQGAVRNLASDLTMGTPQLEVEVDRPFAAELGVPVSAVGGTIQALLGGNRASTFSYRGEIYNVVVELQADLHRERGVIEHIHVTGRAGKPIPLDALVRVTEAAAPAVLSRTDGMRSAKLGADPAPGLAVGEAAAELLRLAQATVPAGVRVEFAGASRTAAEGAGGMAKVVVLALVFIYLVLSAQFESFRDPAIILLAVPLALAGALVGLERMGGSLNLYSVIGLVTLIGLIAKHGILITEFANQLRNEGRGLEDALVEAALLRLRPIVMTTVATVLGAVPLVVGTGAGGASRAQIGMVIVAGMTFGTLVSLFVIPSVYSLLTRKRRQPLLPVPHAPEATTPAAAPLPPPRAAAAE
jgi:multidrug efflux pump